MNKLKLLLSTVVVTALALPLLVFASAPGAPPTGSVAPVFNGLFINTGLELAQNSIIFDGPGPLYFSLGEGAEFANQFTGINYFKISGSGVLSNPTGGTVNIVDNDGVIIDSDNGLGIQGVVSGGINITGDDVGLAITAKNPAGRAGIVLNDYSGNGGLTINSSGDGGLIINSSTGGIDLNTTGGIINSGGGPVRINDALTVTGHLKASSGIGSFSTVVRNGTPSYACWPFNGCGSGGVAIGCFVKKTSGTKMTINELGFDSSGNCYACLTDPATTYQLQTRCFYPNS